MKFMECDACRAKPGSPPLCEGCLHNRTLMTGRIVRSPGIGRRRPPCTALVRVSSANTTTRRGREHQARLAGRDASECGRVSMYLVDGAPRCLNHAGQDAIKILMAAD